MAFKKKYIHI